MGKCPPFVPYAQSLGAIALADPRDKIGLRLAHDRRFDEAHAWALEQFAGDSPGLSRFLCELAMFCELYGSAPEATEFFLEALEKGDPSHGSFTTVLSAALAHSLAILDRDFTGKIFSRISTGGGPSVALNLGEGTKPRIISFPTNVTLPIAEDIVANVIWICFSPDHDSAESGPMVPSTETLFDQLAAYLDAVEASPCNQGSAASASKRVTLAEISLAVLLRLAQRAKRCKSEQELAEIRFAIRDCLQRFGQLIEVYPVSLAAYIPKIVGHCKRRAVAQKWSLHREVLARMATRLHVLLGRRCRETDL